uniref:Anti-CBASS protein Acb1-like N-terminal domain-containing protein n=1 Tax=viral metagenome TaxID=1070528 RepID=A0A6M3L4Q2_9ZZZZ
MSDKVTPISNDLSLKANAALRTLAETIMSRTALADKLGKSYWGSTTGVAQRDLYKTLGYETTPSFNSYYSRYLRQDIAARVVDAPVNAVWRKLPTITEDKDDTTETQFEKAWGLLVKERKVWHYLARADRGAGIGQFGILLLGVDDGNKELDEPLETAKRLLYIRPYMQNAVTVSKWQEDKQQERYGLPEIYTIEAVLRSSTQSSTTTQSFKVHHSRIVHIAEGCLEDDIYGTPRLERVLNRLQDLELISGGSAEMFWRGAFPGYALKADPQTGAGMAQSLDDLEDEVQAYVHEMRRYLRLVNVDIQPLAPQVADPSNHADLLITLIAAAKEIPKRILMGSERGELSSNQDEKAWMDKIDERRRNYCEPMILRPFIDRLMGCGVLPEIPEYTVNWPDLMVVSDKDRAEVSAKLSEALAKYVSAPGAEMVVPFRMYLKKYQFWTDEEIAMVEEEINDLEKNELEEGGTEE